MPIPLEATNAVAAILAGASADEVEHERLEIKAEVRRSAPDTLRLLAETSACLANGHGGVVIVGIDDRLRGSEAILGCTLDVEPTRHRIYELTAPPLVVDVDALAREGRSLLVITVPVSPTVHAVAGRSTERVGTACEPMGTDRIATVIADRRGEDWSAGDSGVALREVDAAALQVARALLARVPDPRRRSHTRLSDEDLCRALGLVTDRLTLTEGGRLLLGPADMVREVVSYVYRRTPTGALAVNEHLHAPLLLALERVFDLVDARVERTSVNVAVGQQLQLADLPESAVREAVINGVMHRDYRRTGVVAAEHSPTTFTVTSPGPFLSGITPRNVLTTSPRTRNPQLSAAIRTLGLAETAGTGVDRMYAAMARIGHQPPRYGAGLDTVQVVLLGGAPNAFVARYTSSLPAEESEDADTMLVLLKLLERRTISATAAAELLQKPEVEAQAVLQRLAASPVAMLEATRETANYSRPNYRLRGDVVAALGTAVTYRRRVPDDYDRKVVALVRESATINARMVRLMLDVDVTTSSRILTDLVRRGILRKTSDAQRGPGVTYGPGAAFPPPPGRKRPRPPATPEG